MKQTKLTFNLFGLVRSLVTLLLSVTKLQIAAKPSFGKVIDHLENVFHTRGVSFGIKYTKETRVILMNYLGGSPILSSEIVGLTGDGLPTFFGDLIPYLRQSRVPTLVLRLLLTILSSTRSLKGEVKPDFDSITSPSLRVSGTLYDTGLASLFWRELGYNCKVFPKALHFKKFHFTTKSGPNGHALGSWLTDFVSLPVSLITPLKTLGGPKMKKILEDWLWVLTWRETFFKIPKMGIIRKLSSFADKEGKTRTIAILDYWSQTVLKPLHSYIFNVLKKIPQDCTFDQNSFKDKIKGWEVYYSVDLSSATDRFPISFIEGVLEGRLPKSYVKAWSQVMVGYPFKCSESREVFYEVGNPMGAYSSWATFALAHHYVMWWLCVQLNIRWKDAKYVLLGDDIVIGDKDLAVAYLAYIKRLGVSFSPMKTHVSPHLCEFAKQWIYKDEEITGFPVSALVTTDKKWYKLLSLFMTESLKKGWTFDVSIPEVVAKYFGVVLKRPSRFRNKILLKAQLGEQILRCIWGLQGAEVTITSYIRLLNLPNIKQPVSRYMSESIISNTIVNLFSESNPQNATKAKGKPLGLLATNWVIFLTGIWEIEPNSKGLRVPILDAYGSIEETYLDLLKKARTIDTIGQGEWPMILRNMTIPLSDSVFTDRVSETEALSAGRLSRDLASNLQMLSLYPEI